MINQQHKFCKGLTKANLRDNMTNVELKYIQIRRSCLLCSTFNVGCIWCEVFCDPGGIQTHDLQNRNLTLYSAKLRSLVGMRLSQWMPLCGIGRPRFLLLTRTHEVLVIINGLTTYKVFTMRLSQWMPLCGIRRPRFLLLTRTHEVLVIINGLTTYKVFTMRLSQWMPLCGIRRTRFSFV